VVNGLLQKLVDARQKPEVPSMGQLVLVYTPLLLGPPTGLWLIYRLVRGYMGLLGLRRVGYVPPPSY